MKLWKKILIGVMILGAVFVSLLAYGTYKVVDEIGTRMEPKMHEYIKLDVEAQNKFIWENMNELLETFVQKGHGAESSVSINDQGEIDKDIWEKIKNDPEYQKAAIQWGRSVCAFAVTNIESVAKELSPEDLTKYQAEADEQEARSEKMRAVMEKYGKEK